MYWWTILKRHLPMHGPEIAMNLLTFGWNKKDRILVWCRIANLHPSLRASDNCSGTLEAAWQCCMQESSIAACRAACRRMIYIRISVQQHMESYIWCVDVMKNATRSAAKSWQVWQAPSRGSRMRVKLSQLEGRPILQNQAPISQTTRFQFPFANV